MQAPQPGWMKRHAGALEGVEVAVLARELLDRLRAELDDRTVTPGATLSPASTASFDHLVVEVEVVDLARRAGAGVGDVDRHLADVVDQRAVGGIGGRCRGRGRRDGRPSAAIAARSMACTPPAYSASGSGATARARSASTSIARPPLERSSRTSRRRPRRWPSRAEHSVAMLASVAALVQRKACADAGPGELHDPVERQLRLGVVQQDVEHHVLGRDVRAQLAGELEADRLRHLDRG